MKDTPNAPPKNGNLGGETTIRIKRSQHAELVQEYGRLGFQNLLSYTTHIFTNRDQIMQPATDYRTAESMLPPPPTTHEAPPSYQGQGQGAPLGNQWKEAYEREARKNQCLQAAIEGMLEFTVQTHENKGLFNLTTWNREGIEERFYSILQQNGLTH